MTYNRVMFSQYRRQLNEFQQTSIGQTLIVSFDFPFDLLKFLMKMNVHVLVRAKGTFCVCRGDPKKPLRFSFEPNFDCGLFNPNIL